MERLLKTIAGSLPLIFAFAFLVPVIDQGMQAAQVSAPFGLTTLTTAILIGGGWGVFALLKGRWV
ncbi:hypothetical protein [Erythrobacter sp. Alg231-14]|uniref:hypothetical protein n=1 Tax=Erythrobacter sp. Alg231-14 TaxID=1922225 RepID=UPI000D55BE3E